MYISIDAFLGHDDRNYGHYNSSLSASRTDTCSLPSLIRKIIRRFYKKFIILDVNTRLIRALGAAGCVEGSGGLTGAVVWRIV